MIEPEMLSEALAERIRTILPRDYTVEASEGWLEIQHDSGRRESIDLEWFLEDCGATNVVLAVEKALDFIQDFIVQTSSAPWPQTESPSRTVLPVPVAAIDENHIKLSYSQGASPVATMEPIPLNET